MFLSLCLLLLWLPEFVAPSENAGSGSVFFQGKEICMSSSLTVEKEGAKESSLFAKQIGNDVWD